MWDCYRTAGFGFNHELGRGACSTEVTDIPKDTVRKPDKEDFVVDTYDFSVPLALYA